MVSAQPDEPDWDRLYETAAAQAGYFTTQQAAEAGYSSQLLLKDELGNVEAALRPFGGLA